jgi:hypothetical protein
VAADERRRPAGENRALQRASFSLSVCTLAAGFVVAFLVMTVVMASVGAPLQDHGGASILAFEFAGAATRAQAVINSWNAEQRLLASFQTGLDYLYIGAYVTALASLAWCIASAGPTRALSVIGRALAWLMPVAGVLDATENVALLRQLVLGGREDLAQIALHCAQGKFAIVSATAGYIAIVGAWVLFRDRRRKGPEPES